MNGASWILKIFRGVISNQLRRCASEKVCAPRFGTWYAFLVLLAATAYSMAFHAEAQSNDQTVLSLVVTGHDFRPEPAVYINSKLLGLAPLTKDLYFSVDETNQPVLRLVLSNYHCEAPFYVESYTVNMQPGVRHPIHLSMALNPFDCLCFGGPSYSLPKLRDSETPFIVPPWSVLNESQNTGAPEDYFVMGAQKSRAQIEEWMKLEAVERSYYRKYLKAFQDDPLVVQLLNLSFTFATKPPAKAVVALSDLPIWTTEPGQGDDYSTCESDPGHSTTAAKLRRKVGQLDDYLELSGEQLGQLAKWLLLKHGMAQIGYPEELSDGNDVFELSQQAGDERGDRGLKFAYKAAVAYFQNNPGDKDQSLLSDIEANYQDAITLREDIKAQRAYFERAVKGVIAKLEKAAQSAKR